MKRKSIIHKFRHLAALLLALASTTTVSAQANVPTMFFIPDSHLDTQWNWDVRTTIGDYLKKTMTENFALLDKYPNFYFNYEGAIKYMWMKEYYPDLYAKLKTYIASGRWHVSGCSVDASDVMTTSGESIIRNFLYAHQFYKKEFGVFGGHDIMLPDCFGFSYALPSLAAHSGLIGFHSQKLSWGSAAYNSLPPFGIWQGVDGSQLYAIYKPGPYDAHEDYNHDMSNDSSRLAKAKENYSKYRIAALMKYVGPRSDHGGGLHDDANSKGENTPYWLNYSVASNGPLKVVLTSPDSIFNYMAKYRTSRLQVWNNELPMRTHGVGSYTSRTMLHLWNRRNELTADAAEKASSLAQWLGAAAYPQADLSNAWIRMLWQQHHDGITGTSIPNAYLFSVNDEVLANKQFSLSLTTALGAIARDLDTEVEGTPVVVYNPLSWDRKDIVEGEMQMASRPDGVRVYDAEGKEVLSQLISYNESTQKAHFIFAATVSSLGCAVYDVRAARPTELTSSLVADSTARTITNGDYTLALTAKGGATLRDLGRSRPLVTNSRLGLLNDESTTWPSWEIGYDFDKRTPREYVDENVKISLEENGPLRKTFRVSSTKAGSTFVQHISMSALTNRVDFRNEVDWQTLATMLKAVFPTSISAEKATFDLSLGTIQRGTISGDHYEFQGHQWADVSTDANEYGVSFLNDSKYGWDRLAKNQLRLTLIHTPKVGGSYTYQAQQDLGVNKFTYSFYPHEGGWGVATQREASQLNQPLVALVSPKHSGTLGKTVSFISLSIDGASVKAVKKAETSDETIVRVYEWEGKNHSNVAINFPADIVAAREVNGVEESVGNVNFSGKSLTFDLKAYEPRTFAVTLAASDKAADFAPTSSTALDLDYDCDVMSYDSNRKDLTSGFAYAYPAEEVPDTIVSEGISFKMGPKADGENNALRCNGQTLTLKRAAGQNKLYLLMASTQASGTEAEVKQGDAVTTFSVPYYSGYVGQFGSPFNNGTSYRKQDVALTATHSHQASNGENAIYKFLYIYKYVLELPENATEITLPADNNLLLLAATVSDNQADDVKPFSTINTYIDYTELGDNDESGCGRNLVPTKVRYSRQNGTAEAATMAADNDPLTKWCVTRNQGDKTPWLEYYFQEPVEVCKYSLLNAGCESGDYITRAYKVQYNYNGKWITVDSLGDNRDNRIEHGVTPFSAKRIRLQILQPQQNDDPTTRIYEFALYGKSATTGITLPATGSKTTSLRLQGCWPNPAPNSTTVSCFVPDGVQKVELDIYSQDGRLVGSQRYSVSHGNHQLPLHTALANGIYLYRLKSVAGDRTGLTSETRRLMINQ